MRYQLFVPDCLKAAPHLAAAFMQILRTEEVPLCEFSHKPWSAAADRAFR